MMQLKHLLLVYFHLRLHHINLKKMFAILAKFGFGTLGQYQGIHRFTSSVLGWLVVLLNGPFRQYFSLYWAVSKRERERKEK